MIDVEWDVAQQTRDYIDANWGGVPGSENPDRPHHIELYTEDESGNARRGVDYTREYILVMESGERNRPYVDGPRDVVDADATVRMEASTPNGRARREEMWRELMALAEHARKRSAGTPGNWDTVTMDSTTVDDEVFNWWTVEVEWLYEAEARTI